MKIRVFYPVRNKERNFDKDWDVRVNYKDEFPTKADIAKDYKELPIPKKYWNAWNLNRIDKKYCKSILDEIFKLMNNDNRNPLSTPEMQTWIRENKVRHTSMSV